MILAAVTVLSVWDLTVDDGGWTPGEGAEWEWGLADKGPATVGWATRLDRPYLNDSVDTLELPLPDLLGATRPRFVLRHAYTFAAGDAGHLEVHDANGWRALSPAYASEVTFRGSSAGWTESAWWLDGMSGLDRARLVFVADTTGADDGWFVSGASVVDGDAVPPRVSPVTVPVDNQDVRTAPRVVVAAEDDLALLGVDAVVSFDGGAPERFGMTDQRDGTYAVDLPVVAPGTTVAWHAAARDSENEGRWPTDEDATFRVYLAAPEAVTGPSGRVIGDEVTLSWSPPDSPWPVLGYAVFAAGDDAPVAEVLGLAAAVPIDGPQAFTVRARYADGLGDASSPVWIDAEVPQLTGIEPGVLRAGETRRIAILGESFYFDADATVDFGPDVEVLDVSVVDVSRLDAVVSVAATAGEGPRDLSVTGAWGDSTHPDALRIEGVAATALVADPATMAQGGSGSVVVTAPEAFAGPLRRADTDASIVASELGEPDGRTAALSVAVARAAAPGAHRLWFDDGLRWWSVDLTVEERVEAPRSCAPAAAWPLGWAWVAVLGLRRRRARG